MVASNLTRVDGNLRFETTNGGVTLDRISGDVNGHTINGALNVSSPAITGRGTACMWIRPMAASISAFRSTTTRTWKRAL